MKLLLKAPSSGGCSWIKYFFLTPSQIYPVYFHINIYLSNFAEFSDCEVWRDLVLGLQRRDLRSGLLVRSARHFKNENLRVAECPVYHLPARALSQCVSSGDLRTVQSDWQKIYFDICAEACNATLYDTVLTYRPLRPIPLHCDLDKKSASRDEDDDWW